VFPECISTNDVEGMKAAATALIKRFAPQALRVARLRRKAGRVLMDWRAPLSRGLAGESWAAIRDRAQADRQAPRVLMATTVGGHLAAVQFDAMIAAALTLRGANVAFLLCDAALPACMVDQHDWYADRRRFLEPPLERSVCRTCWPVGEKYLAPLGLPMLRLSELVGDHARQEAYAAADAVDPAAAGDWRFRDLPVGEHGLAGALRFHARADLDGVPHGREVLARYLRAGAVAAVAAGNVAARFPYDVLVAHHGIYIPQGIWVAATHKAGRRVVTWNPGYKTGSFVLSQNDTYHKTMISEDTALWETLPLDEARRALLHDYLRKRRSGAGDWISFGSGQSGEFRESLGRLGLDPARPTVGLLTSVMWDAQLHYDSNAFASQLDWLDATIEHFSARPELNLIVRVHPAEITGFIPSEQRAADHIAKKFGRLPANIAVVGPENPLSTYALMDGCDSVLIYSTKTGIELSAIGIPVVVAGEAWIRNKGFSIDANSPDDYRAILERLPLGRRLSAAEQERAERYAWHFFFRRMVELPGFQKHAGWPPYRAAIDSLDALAPGADANLDMACREIVAGGPFLAATPYIKHR
jgi:hypothetical protein